VTLGRQGPHLAVADLHRFSRGQSCDRGSATDHRYAVIDRIACVLRRFADEPVAEIVQSGELNLVDHLQKTGFRLIFTTVNPVAMF
jgi:hypothetical protein